MMDSIARVQSGARATSAGSIATKTEKPVTPAVRKEMVDQLLDYAKTFLGVPYRLGASGPNLFGGNGGPACDLFLETTGR